MNIKEFFDKKAILIALTSFASGIAVFFLVILIFGGRDFRATHELVNFTTETIDGETTAQEYVSPLLYNYIANLQQEKDILGTDISGLRDVVERQASKISEMQNWQPLPPYSTILRNSDAQRDTSSIYIDENFSCENTNESIGGELQHPTLGQIDFSLNGELETSVSLAKKCRLNAETHLGIATFRASASNLESRTHQMRTHFVLFLYSSDETVFAVSDPLVVQIPYSDNFSFSRADSSSIHIEGKYGDAGHLFEQSAVLDLKSFTFTKNESSVHSPDIEFQE